MVSRETSDNRTFCWHVLRASAHESEVSDANARPATLPSLWLVAGGSRETAMPKDHSTGPDTPSTNETDRAPKVGNKCPPKHSQFKRGVSGNPAGRPKGALGLKTLLAAELKSTIKIQEAGRSKTVTKQQAMVKQFVGKALNRRC